MVPNVSFLVEWSLTYPFSSPPNPPHPIPDDDDPSISLSHTENPDSEDQNQAQISAIPIASISLSLSTVLPYHFLSPFQKIASIFTPANKVKIPSQISSLSNLSISSSLSPTKPFFKLTISANPLQSPLILNPLRPSEPSNAAALCRTSIVWFRNDLRVHDNECLTFAHNESMSVLPVYCFDPRDYGKSSSGFDKTGPYRATFLIESVGWGGGGLGWG
ncbi:Blue-light photoreceptor PHR2 [Abeliophyllum distichum]|uniref:Blue-light photoreceptor PHR2 n=1 Tax=Abeliophyllum distichum TaxID=126358 RepID=A0ABD1QYU9_9LAMI